MRNIILFLSISLLATACGTHTNDAKNMQVRIDSLQNKLDHTYRPGLGEFMLNIQIHHAKLWFAGIEQNWKLADFEAGEISETLEAIKQYNTDRPELKSLPMIDPAVDSINAAIKLKDPVLFRSSFILLTNTCNNCHRTTGHEFNVIKLPDNPPFSNQVFKPQ